MAEPLVPKRSTILVTGVNSFIGSNVADELLANGYNVRGTVRSQTKGEELKMHFEEIYGGDRFELVVIEDITLNDAFDEAIKGVAGVCHVATAAALTTDYETAMSRTVAGAINIFRPAIRELSVKSVVYTSDSYAVLLPEANKEATITTSDYNDYAINIAESPSELERIKSKAWDPSTAVEFVIWAAAKASAEKAVWQFVSDQQPQFQVSSVIPNMNFGAPVGDLPLSSTGKSIPDLLLQKPHPDLYFPAQHFVNVRDCAKLHVAALLDPAAAGQRLFACAAPFNWNDVLRILRDLRPEEAIREDFRDIGRDLSVLPNVAAEQLLRKWFGHGWTNLEETVGRNVEKV